MSVEFGYESRPERMLLRRFLDEVSTVLDEGVPFTRRAALLRKWCIVLRRLSSRARGDCSAPSSPEEAEEMAEELIELAVDIILAWGA